VVQLQFQDSSRTLFPFQRRGGVAPFASYPNFPQRTFLLLAAPAGRRLLALAAMMHHRTYLPTLMKYLGMCTVAFNARLLQHMDVLFRPPVLDSLVAVAATRNHAPAPSVADHNTEKDRPGSFSACLLWMDDNFRLPEWLAYHYYVMNLRYVVIHPDPRSKGSPLPVLDQWKDRIHIVEWTDPSTFSGNTYDAVSDASDASRNRTAAEKLERAQEQTKWFFRRQIDFYNSCAMHMKSQNRTWTSFHDSDEFMVVVKNSINAGVTRGNATDGIAKDDEPGRALQIVNRYYHADWNEREGALRPVEHAWRREAHADWDFWFSALPCVVLPRVLMGSSATSLEQNVDADADDADFPVFLDADRFDTLRYRVQGTEKGGTGGPGKAIVDVSRLPDNAIELAWGGTAPAGVHRPFGDLCTNAWAPSNGLPLAFHHYVGSWEAFSYRDDVRKGVERTFAKWKAQSAMRDGGVNDDARGGIRGFVKMVGEAAAQAMLRDAGLPRNYTRPTNDTSDWEAIEIA
jgi:hypothetical protein